MVVKRAASLCGSTQEQVSHDEFGLLVWTCWITNYELRISTNPASHSLVTRPVWLENIRDWIFSTFTIDSWFTIPWWVTVLKSYFAERESWWVCLSFSRLSLSLSCEWFFCFVFGLFTTVDGLLLHGWVGLFVRKLRVSLLTILFNLSELWIAQVTSQP